MVEGCPVRVGVKTQQEVHMTNNLLWSISLAAIGILGIYLAGNKSPLGWAVSFSAQAMWIVFAIVTAQYGFILSALAYGWVYGRNYLRWRKDTTGGAHDHQRLHEPD
jgi:hypothetical protein